MEVARSDAAALSFVPRGRRRLHQSRNRRIRARRPCRHGGGRDAPGWRSFVFVLSSEAAFCLGARDVDEEVIDGRFNWEVSVFGTVEVARGPRNTLHGLHGCGHGWWGTDQRVPEPTLHIDPNVSHLF